MTLLYTESEIGFERVFEIRVRDLKERKGVKQRSFSLSVVKGTRDQDYISAEELKDHLERYVKEKLNDAQ